MLYLTAGVSSWIPYHVFLNSLPTEFHSSGHKDHARELRPSVNILTEPRVLYQWIARALAKNVVTILY